MLTIDDCNTLIEKYKDSGFWYKIDFSKIDPTLGTTTQYDFCTITVTQQPNPEQFLVGKAEITILNSLWTGSYYLTSGGGQVFGWPLTETEIDNTYNCSFESNWELYLYLTPNPVDEFQLKSLMYEGGFLTLSPTTIPIVNGEYDDKLYVLDSPYMNYITIDGERVSMEQDAHLNYFIRLPAHDCVIGCNDRNEVDCSLYYVKFREFKTIPTLSIPVLYKGTPQEVKLYNEDTQEYITEFQAYYQGRKLKDNIVTLPYDCDDIVDIVIDILDPNYPTSRVKLKAMTEYCIATSQAEVETAISNGIQTMQVINNNTPVSLTDITLTDVLFIDSKITIDESTLTNVTILDTTYTDNGDNTLSDCTIKTSTLTSTGNPSTYTECKILECDITGMELHLTGTLTDNELTETLIISDGVIEITDNIFTDKNSKDYFPSFLYLTGDYNVKNNTFTLDDEWTEPAFNMCIIKTIEPFTPNQFISNNTFDLNIEYSTEDPNTFYYNIVDDDKIKAVRLN